jgi:hypothetical protein
MWCASFLRTGGVQHLLGIFLTCDINLMCSGPLTKGCLAELLQLITRFVLPPDEEDEDSKDKEDRMPVAVAAKEVAAIPSREYDDYDDLPIAPHNEDGPISPVQTTVEAAQPFAMDVGLDVPTLLTSIDVALVARRLLSVMYTVSRTSAAESGDEGFVHRKENRRRSRQARIEDYYRSSNTTQGTAMDMIDWGDDKDEEDEEVQLSAEAQVVQHAISLLVAITLSQPTLLDVVLGFQELSEALMYSLLRAPEASLRTVVARGILRLCDKLEGEVSAPAARFTSLLMPFVEDAEQYARTCFEFFTVLSTLIVKPNALSNDDAASLASRLTERVCERSVNEITEEDEDLVLRGMLGLLQSSLAALSIEAEDAIKCSVGLSIPEGKGLIDEIFRNCLFALPQRNNDYSSNAAKPPKCKNSKTRGAAFLLLWELARNCVSNFNKILNLVAPHHVLGLGENKEAESKSASTSSAISSAYFMSKSKTGYVGLKNLGCICYMNSSMQQFFMTPGEHEAW